MDLAQIAAVLAPLVALIVGYLAYSHQRQVKLKVAEKRLAAYQALWSRMEVASPFRQTIWNAQPLKREEREKLFKNFTAWYYEDGNGMFMGDSTRAIYLTAKDNLVRDIKYFEPTSIRERLRQLPPEEQERKRGYLSIRQLSLLRNRMKADLGVFGIPYHVNLNNLDEEFLEACGEDLEEKPWNESKREQDQTGQEVEIFPEEP